MLLEQTELSRSIADIAREAQMSPSHLIRQFEAVFGVTPHQFRIDSRFQAAMFNQGIPLAAFEVSDLQTEYARLLKQDVAFTREPTKAGPVTIAVLADTCGKLIQLYQPS